MINKAAVSCLMLLKSRAGRSIDWNCWENDILARLYWNTLMFESIIVQELSVPPSGLTDFEDDVPLPRFLSYEKNKLRPLDDAETENLDDSFYQYHFLAQAAHRILLNRIRKTIYMSDPELPNFPSIFLTRELQHQLDLWKSHHPPFIQNNPKDTTSVSSSTKLASYIMSAMLHGRYLVGKHLLRRPFVYKILHCSSNETINPDDLAEVKECLDSCLNWPQVTGIFGFARTAIPIKFGFGSQFFWAIAPSESC